MGTKEPKVVVEDLSKWYTTRTGVLHVLDSINLEIGSGEFVSIVGASGCGKTTFLRIADGLEPFDAGRVLVDGRPVTGPDRSRAVVFQQDLLYPWRTVQENIWFGLEAQGEPAGNRRRVAAELIELVGLRGFAEHYPHELSGGMRQRVNLARAMAMDPDVLLMDEPFAALDAQTREVMQRELLRIWNEKRKTVMFITHQIDEALYLSDRVIVFSARPGRVRASIDVQLDRPRPLSIKRTPAFARYAEQVWDLIEAEVLEAAVSEPTDARR